MPSGIGASITTLTNGTTANAGDVLSSLNALNAAGVSNDGATITTSGSGVITAANGRLINLTFITPYQLTTNPTVTSGSTTTLTCTGVGGIPSGALGVWIGGGLFASTVANGYVTIMPHGGTSGQYVSWSSPGNNTFNGNSFMCPLDATGKIDVKANSSNMILQTWYIYAYIN